MYKEMLKQGVKIKIIGDSLASGGGEFYELFNSRLDF